MSAKEIKKILFDLGADLCNIASIDRFEEAPDGFHPCDTLPSCQSVIVFAKKFLAGSLQCNSTIPYTVVRNILSDKLDKISVEFCGLMEEKGIIAVPTGTIGPGVEDKKTGRFRNIVSAKHCAVAAGMGRIGKNTLVVTPEYGNMVWLCAVLTEEKLEADPVLTGDPCPPGCSRCIDNCPANALGDLEMDQRACHAHAFQVDEGDDFHFKCHLCRTMCPNCLGSKNRRIISA